MVQDGVPVMEIAKHFGVHRTTVRDGLRLRGVDTSQWKPTRTVSDDEQTTTAYYAKRKQDGVCIYCKGQRDSEYLRCQSCRDKLAARRKTVTDKLRSEGRCPCGADATTSHKNDKLCMPCWFRKVAKGRTRNECSWEMLQKLLLEQNGCCTYSREKLVPGVNASLDHKIPVSRGGRNTIDNLQWVTQRINSMKSDMTHEEFVSLCAIIANPPSLRDAEGLAKASESSVSLKREAIGL